MASNSLPSRPPRPTAPPLPPGWAEHKAPTATKTSTYTRPLPPQAPGHPRPPNYIPPEQQFPYAAAMGALPPGPTPIPQPYGQYSTPKYPPQPYTYPQQFSPQPYPYPQQFPPQGRGRGGGPSAYPNAPRSSRTRKPEKQDRPKKKRGIPNMEPWVLVTTKLGRQFVHNTVTKESLWKAPEEVQKALDKMKEMSEEVLKKWDEEYRRKREDEKERERQKERERIKEEKEKEEEEEEVGGEYEYEQVEEEEEEQADEEGVAEPRGRKRSASAALGGDGGPEEENDEEHAEKRARTTPAPTAPVEFTEEDIAYQLESLAADYGLGEEDLEADSELPPEEAAHIFKEMLSEHNVNPYATFDQIISSIVGDDRYTVLNTTRHRKHAFTEWCKEWIAELKIEREREKSEENPAKRDPKVAFWEFLSRNRSQVTKLYWAEFKRKFKKEKEMKDVRLPGGDKEREKMYREFVAHQKLPTDKLESSLRALLKSTPSLTRATTLSSLPPSILADVRYAAKLPSNLTPRDKLVESYLSSLPASTDARPADVEEVEEDKSLQALRERERMVRREQRRLRGEIEKERGVLKEGEREIERAKEVGKRGLLTHFVREE
ncbi:hypothetical protein BDZ91DRAFT_677775, partial [Kalaharituber pfeilii]